MHITVISKQKKGKDVKIEVGSKDKDANKITLTLYNVSNESEMRKQAEAELKRRAYNGYTGTITGFGAPRTQAGDSLKIIDPDNPEREGT